MTDLSFPIEYLKKSAKALTKQVAAGDTEACKRARTVFADLAEKPDAEVDAGFGLMRAQHVIAVEHGFTKWKELAEGSPVELHLAITMAKEPFLTDFGIGLYEEARKLPKEQREAKLREERKTLRKSVDAVWRTVDWLRENIQPIKTINTKHSSYGLKHVAEKDVGYITNGVFIAAAMIAGYPYKIEYGSPSPYFGMSEKSITRIVKKHRPMPPANRRYIGDEEQNAALIAAGWRTTDPGFWIAPPGTAPDGEWSTQSAFGYLLLGEAMRTLAARGWDVPEEYVGEVGVATLGQYVKHAVKAPRHIRVSTALDLEGLPPLHPLAAERA